MPQIIAVNDSKTAGTIVCWSLTGSVEVSKFIANWLVGLAYRCKAIALRPRGGVYFIPQAHVAEFAQYVEVLHETAVGSHVYQIPAMQSDAAVQAILAALQAEVSEALAEINEDIASCVQNRVKDSRRLRCAKLQEKVKVYADLLQVNLDSLQDSIEETANV